MSVSVLIAVVLIIMALGYQLGRKRALAGVGGLSQMRHLHSLPSYYGSYVMLWAALPSALILLLWSLGQDAVLTSIMKSHLPEQMLSLSDDRLGLMVSTIKQYALTGYMAGGAKSRRPSKQRRMNTTTWHLLRVWRKRHWLSLLQRLR